MLRNLAGSLHSLAPLLLLLLLIAIILDCSTFLTLVAVLQLMKVLSNKEFEHIVTWMPSGKSFSIVDSKAFVAEILPEHFKSAKYASFTRKLHRWGFMRHYRGEEAGAFYHRLFQKDRLDLVEQMTCHKEQLASQNARKISKIVDVAPRPMQNLISTQQQPQQQPQQPQLAAPLGDDMLAKLRQQLSLSGLQQQPQQPPQVGAAQRLNAAIELEVVRRLKERIQAAAVSRQTLALVNQLTQQQQQPPQQAPLPQPAPPALAFGLNGNLQAQLLQQQQLGLSAQMMNKSLKSQLGLGDLLASPMEGMGLEQLPSVNVPSARTA